MRSLIAGLAAAWFALQALNFTPPSGVFFNDQIGAIDGEPTVVAVTYGVRTVCAGLTLLALALVDWAWIVRRIREADERQRKPEG